MSRLVNKFVKGGSTSGARLTSSGLAAAPTWSNISTTVSVTLTDGASVALDASLGTVFTLTSTTSPTIAAPTNPTADQKIMIRYKNNQGGSVTLGLNSAFTFGSDIGALTATPNGTTDYIGCIYNSATSKWNVIAYAKGY